MAMSRWGDMGGYQVPDVRQGLRQYLRREKAVALSVEPQRWYSPCWEVDKIFLRHQHQNFTALDYRLATLDINLVDEQKKGLAESELLDIWAASEMIVAAESLERQLVALAWSALAEQAAPVAHFNRHIDERLPKFLRLIDDCVGDSAMVFVRPELGFFLRRVAQVAVDGVLDTGTHQVPIAYDVIPETMVEDGVFETAAYVVDLDDLVEQWCPVEVEGRAYRSNDGYYCWQQITNRWDFQLICSVASQVKASNAAAITGLLYEPARWLGGASE